MEVQFFGLFEGDSSMRGKINYTLSFQHEGKIENFESNSLKDISSRIFDWLYSKNYSFEGKIHNSITRKLLNKSELDNLVKTTSYGYRSFHNVGGSDNFLINSYNSNIMINFIIEMLKNFGIEEKLIKHGGFKDIYQKTTIDDSDLRVFVVRSGVSNRDSKLFIDDNFVAIDYGTNFNINDKSKEEIFQFLTQNGASKNQALQYVQQIELFKEISVGDIVLVPDSDGINVGEVSSDIYYVDEKYPNRLEVEWLDKIERNNSVNLPRTVFEIKNFDIENYEFTPTNEIVPELTPVDEPEEEIQKFSNLFPKSFKAVQAQEEREKTIEKKFVKNPFGCKQEDSTQTSSLCILGKSGSGKTTTTEQALENMGHEYLVYIPIEGEYTFSQFTGQSFEMSSLGEFIMMAQNNPDKYYTVIFDECHRPITISKLNTDLLQALSSRRNRGGERFFTMDRLTKKMYTKSDEFEKSLKEVTGKVLVPDNFGIVCLSSQPAVICRNEDFLNRVDIVVFDKRYQKTEDLRQLTKLKPDQKNIETIRGLLASDGTE